jgi:hypothetical protein|nr:hypothetical protein [Methanoculleus marisnigri]
MHTMTPEEKAYLISIGSASIDEALSADLLPAPATGASASRLTPHRRSGSFRTETGSR